MFGNSLLGVWPPFFSALEVVLTGVLGTAGLALVWGISCVLYVYKVSLFVLWFLFGVHVFSLSCFQFNTSRKTRLQNGLLSVEWDIKDDKTLLI